MMIVTRSDSIGGSSIHVRDVAAQLQRDGNDVVVLLGGQGPVVPLLHAAGVRTVNVPHLIRAIRPHHDVRAVVRIAREVRAFKPDVLSLHTSKAGAVGRIAGQLTRTPAVYAAHGWAFTDGVPHREARRYALAENLLAWLPGTIVNVCGHERDVALQHNVGSRKHHTVIHNGVVDVPASLRSVPDGRPVRIVSVARFEAPKDHVTLLKALAGLPEGEPWRLLLLGHGPLKASVEAMSRELGLADRVEIREGVTDVAPALAEADLFVLSSTWEGFPRSILEAMRAGLPVVATDVGGIREAVEEAVTGRLVPRRDVPALRDALASLVADGEARVRMGRAGRERYEQRFTFDAMYDAWLGLYQSVAKRRRDAGRAAST